MNFTDEQISKWIKLTENGVNKFYTTSTLPFKSKLVEARMMIDRHGSFVSDIFFNPLLKEYVEKELNCRDTIWGSDIHYTNACSLEIGLLISNCKLFKVDSTDTKYITTFSVK
jgi:hypothetical protein